jgi:hypothetical protein
LSLGGIGPRIPRLRLGELLVEDGSLAGRYQDDHKDGDEKNSY